MSRPASGLESLDDDHAPAAARERMRERLGFSLTRAAGTAGLAERALAVHDPFGLAQRCEIGGEGAALAEAGVIAEELQAAGDMKGGELFQEQAPKQPREHADGEEEAGPA